MSRFSFLAISIELFWGVLLLGGSLCAQELAFSGVGPINHSLAGVGVALPRDSAGGIYWNPGTVSFLNQSEFQFGMGRHNGPWYGDEYPAGTVAVAGVIIGWLILESLDDDSHDDDWLSDSPSKPSRPTEPDPNPPPTEPEPSGVPSPHLMKIRVPTLSYVYRVPDTRWTFGLGISEYGARKIGTILNEPRDEILGIAQYRFQGYEFIPALSYRENKRLSYGVSPIFSIDETPNNSLPVIPTTGRGGVVLQEKRAKFGVGFQYGIYYQAGNRFRFGFSIRTPQWIGESTYRWIDPTTGAKHVKKFWGSQDSATRIGFGTAYASRNRKTTYAADFRYYDFSHVSSLYDIPASFDPEVQKLGAARGVYSLALGLEYLWVHGLWLRAGYQFNYAVNPGKAVYYNTALPIQTGHSIHYGFTVLLSESLDFSMSVSNSFAGGRETIQTESGPVSYRKNPNRSDFWFAFRFLF